MLKCIQSVARYGRLSRYAIGNAKIAWNSFATKDSSIQTPHLDVKTPADRKQMAALMSEAVRTENHTSDFVPSVLIRQLCSRFQDMNIDDKKEFLLILARDLHVDTNQVQQGIRYFQAELDAMQSGSVEWEKDEVERYLRTFRSLRQSLTPLYETFFQQVLSQHGNGMLFLVHMRADMLQILRKRIAVGSEASALRSMDASLKSFLASWFSVGFLKLERVTYEKSSGELLEKIIRYEAVHPVGTIAELKRRLGSGRRCFAFFHPSIPDEPLVFVHVALVSELASSMDYIREGTEQLPDSTKASAAIFYSISSTQKGLQGIDLGNFLIKEVAKALQTDLPQLSTFATLSPMPQFMPWLESQRHTLDRDLIKKEDMDVLRKMCEEEGVFSTNESDVGVVLDLLQVDGWEKNPLLEQALRPVLLRLGAHYIYLEKKRSKALCPVANFHIRNGAIFERLNWLADLSPKGLSQSGGMMVNYKYDLAAVEENNEQYLLANRIPIGKQPRELLEMEK